MTKINQLDIFRNRKNKNLKPKLILHSKPLEVRVIVEENYEWDCGNQVLGLVLDHPGYFQNSWVQKSRTDLYKLIKE